MLHEFAYDQVAVDAASTDASAVETTSGSARSLVPAGPPSRSPLLPHAVMAIVQTVTSAARLALDIPGD